MHEDVKAVGLDNKTRSKGYNIDKVYYKCHFSNACNACKIFLEHKINSVLSFCYEDILYNKGK